MLVTPCYLLQFVTVVLPVSEKGHVFTFHFPPPHLSLKSGEEFSTRCSVSPSPSIRALHSGVSVLEHSGNDVGINGDAHNSAGAADVSKSLHYTYPPMQRIELIWPVDTTTPDYLRPFGWCGP